MDIAKAVSRPFFYQKMGVHDYMKTDFSKAEAIKIVTLAAKEYKEKLEGKNLLFVYLNGNHIESFETLFQGNTICQAPACWKI